MLIHDIPSFFLVKSCETQGPPAEAEDENLRVGKHGETMVFNYHILPPKTNGFSMFFWQTLSPTGWWFGTFLFFHILGIIIPTDFHIFWEGLKSPTSQQSSLIQWYDVWFWLMATWPRTSPHMVMTYGVCWLLAIGRLDYYGQLYACSLLIWTTVDRTLGGRRNSALLRVKSDEKSMTWFSGKKKTIALWEELAGWSHGGSHGKRGLRDTSRYAECWALQTTCWIHIFVGVNEYSWGLPSGKLT